MERKCKQRRLTISPMSKKQATSDQIIEHRKKKTNDVGNPVSWLGQVEKCRGINR
jgi:hypothetical protein